MAELPFDTIISGDTVLHLKRHHRSLGICVSVIFPSYLDIDLCVHDSFLRMTPTEDLKFPLNIFLIIDMQVLFITISKRSKPGTIGIGALMR